MKIFLFGLQFIGQNFTVYLLRHKAEVQKSKESNNKADWAESKRLKRNMKTTLRNKPKRNGQQIQEPQRHMMEHTEERSRHREPT